MFEAGKRAEDVGNWSSNIEEPIAEADKEVLWLEKWLLETNEEIEHWKQKDDEERKACTREEELKFEREQMEMKLEFQHHLEEAKAKQQPVEEANWIEQRTTKLPKLQITKFNGTYEAWLPFWKKFQAKIDKANLASVTKFAYLKELVDPKVRGEIDRLPFTTEGYKRTKNILICENGKMREIVNTYVQNIVNLPVITGTQPALIHEFGKRERESSTLMNIDARCLWCFCKSKCKCPLTQGLSQNRPSTTEPALERVDSKQVLSHGNSWQFKTSIFISLKLKRRPRCLLLLLVKRSTEQASRNLMIHSSTLWFGTISILLGHSYRNIYRDTKRLTQN